MRQSYPTRKIFEAHPVALLLCSALAIAACGKKAQITGEVKDGFGQPLKDATVGIEGTTFKAVTDGGGKYAIEYVPGKITATYTKDGYTSDSASFDIATETTFPAKQITLYRVPQQKWVYHFGAQDYAQLKQGALNVRTQRFEVSINSPDFRSQMISGPDSEETFYVSGEFTSLPSGSTLRFLDTDSRRRMALFKLSGGEVVVTHTYYRPSSVQDKAEIINESVKSIASGVVIREASLSPGKYAFATLGGGIESAARFGQRRANFFGSGGAPVTPPVYLLEVK